MPASKSIGCVQCHRDSHYPHFKETVRLGCVACHFVQDVHGNTRLQEQVPVHRLPRRGRYARGALDDRARLRHLRPGREGPQGSEDPFRAQRRRVGIAFSTNVPHTVRGGPTLVKTGPTRAAPSHPETYLPGRNETKQCTDCHVSQGQRQQRHHGPAADAGHRTTSTSSAGTAGSPPASTACAASSSPSATSRRRSSAARCTSSPSPTTSRSTSSARRRAGARPRAPRQGHRRAAAQARSRKPEVLERADPRRVPVRGLRRGRRARLRHRLHRQQGRSPSGSPPPRSRRWASSSTSARSTPRPSPPRRPSPPTRRARTSPENQEQTVHPLYGYIYVADKYEGLITRRRRHAARRQPAEQLPRSAR